MREATAQAIAIEHTVPTKHTPTALDGATS